jgi:lipopolysaccharide/colanic/teichoic acid biosynthesis glycosyltransferase
LLKRAFDIVVSSFLLVLGAPLFLVIAGGIFLSSPGPVLFRQERAGREGRTFVLYKFRTMHPGPSGAGETFAGDPRVFPFGRLLREYHLDELPQLWNVLIGDMSLVGPRPGLPSQVERYTERERGRLRVRPGLTGLAQVSGNNELEWSDRIEVDLQYAAHASFFLDLQILFRTIGTVLRKQGVYGPDGWVRDKR